jgi:lactate dehydrogenase-like 2-hydroxyacid dehydrogenase
MARCFVTRRIPGSALDRLRESHDVDLWPERTPPPHEELLARAKGCEGLLSLLTDRLDAETLEALPELRAISNYAVGFDNVDIEAATRRGIPVGHTPEVLTDTTADLAWAILMAAARRLAEGEAFARSGEWVTWEPDFLLGRDVHGATLGVMGYGAIGRAVARRAQGFDMEVLYSDPIHEGGVSVEELQARSDFLSLHAPLTPETHHVIDEAALRRMKDGAILVNTARGPLVDPDALGRALEEGWIAGAALDVTDPEPLPADHPLLSAPNLLVVPHVGSSTQGTRAAMSDLAVDNLLAGLAGERMPRCANSAVYA